VLVQHLNAGVAKAGCQLAAQTLKLPALIGYIFRLAIVECFAARCHDCVGNIFIAVSNFQSRVPRAFDLIVKFVIGQVAGRDNAMQQVTTDGLPQKTAGGRAF